MSAHHPLAALKLLVISLGLILIGGTALLVGMVWKKGDGTSGTCAESKLDLTGRGAIVESVAEGNILRMTLEKMPGHSEIITVDTCAGRMLGSLVIKSDPVVSVAE